MKKERQKRLWRLVGHVGVDSGQILLCDPCYLPERRLARSTGEPIKPSEQEEWQAVPCVDLHRPEFVGEFSYRGACSTTGHFGAGQLYFRLGHAGAGVVSNTGHGDGVYPVYGLFDREGHCLSLRVCFDGEEEPPVETAHPHPPRRREDLVLQAKKSEKQQRTA